MKFTRIPENTFKQLQLNAGILSSNFDPVTGEVQEEELIGATTGGVNFTATPEYTDWGEDIDNCPVNVKELKKLSNWTITMSGTFITVDARATARLIGAGGIDADDPTKITPRNDVLVTDFQDLWWIGDYSNVNDDNEKDGKAGYVAVHMLNALSTGGFQIQSANREKGQFAFEFTGHYSIEDQNKVPFEVYVMSGYTELGSNMMKVTSNEGNLEGYITGGNGVDVNTIMDKDVKVNWAGTDGTVVGTFPYKNEFTEFSNKADEKKGHYFAFEIDEAYADKPITVTGTKATTAVDRKWVLRIDGVVAEKKPFTVAVDGNTIMTLDFNKATLKPGT